MHRGEGEAGTGMPSWAGRLHAGRPTASEGTAGGGPRPDLPASLTSHGRGHAGRGDPSLPWLDPADDDDGEDYGDSGRPFRRFAGGLVVLALLAAGVWWAVAASGSGEPDGSLIQAEDGPYKVRPQAPGGKTFAGTGDSAYAVSQGQDRDAALGLRTGEPGSSDRAGAAHDDSAHGRGGGVGVQVGAFMDAQAAEAGWASLVQRNPMLSGVAHRVVPGPGDIGTVYRLQAVTASLAAAQSLCQALREAGQECQVRP